MRFHLLVLSAAIASTFHLGKCAIVPAQQVDPNSVVGSPEHIASLFQDGIRFRRDAYGRGYHRGQTQSQYLNFGAVQNEGKAEAEATQHGTRAYVAGSNGMGQAQSQSAGGDCGDCVGAAGGGGSFDGTRPDPILHPGLSGRTSGLVDNQGRPIIDKLQLPDGRRWTDSRPGVLEDTRGPATGTYAGQGQTGLPAGRYQPSVNGSPAGYPGVSVDGSGRPISQFQPGYGPSGAPGAISGGLPGGKLSGIPEERPGTVPGRTSSGFPAGTSGGFPGGTSSGLPGGVPSGISRDINGRGSPGTVGDAEANSGRGTPGYMGENGGIGGSLRPGISSSPGQVQQPLHGPGATKDAGEYRPGPGAGVSGGQTTGTSEGLGYTPSSGSFQSSGVGPGTGYQPGVSSGTAYQPSRTPGTTTGTYHDSRPPVVSNGSPSTLGGNGLSGQTGYSPEIRGNGATSSGIGPATLPGTSGQAGQEVSPNGQSLSGNGINGVHSPTGSVSGIGSGDAKLWTPVGPTILCLTISCPGGATPQISTQYLPSKPGQLITVDRGSGILLTPGHGVGSSSGVLPPGTARQYPGQYPGVSSGVVPETAGPATRSPEGQYPSTVPGGVGQYPSGTQYPSLGDHVPAGPAAGVTHGVFGPGHSAGTISPGGAREYPSAVGHYPGASGAEIWGQTPSGGYPTGGSAGNVPTTGPYLSGGVGQYPSQLVTGDGGSLTPGRQITGHGVGGRSGPLQPGITGQYPEQYPGGAGVSSGGGPGTLTPGGQYPGNTYRSTGRYPASEAQFPAGVSSGGGITPGSFGSGSPGTISPGGISGYPSGARQYPGAPGTGIINGVGTGPWGQIPSGGSGYADGKSTGSVPAAGQYPGQLITGNGGSSIPLVPGNQISGQYPRQYPGGIESASVGPGTLSPGGQYPGNIQGNFGQYPLPGGQFPAGSGGGIGPGAFGPGGATGQYPGGASGVGGQYPGGIGSSTGGVTGGQYPVGIGGSQYPAGSSGQYPGGVNGLQYLKDGGVQYPGGVGGVQYPGGYIPTGGVLHSGQYTGTVTGLGEEDDAFAQSETAVKEGEATASAQGKRAGGVAQTQVSGSYSSGGSFSANAQTSDKDRAAQAQVTGNKDGAMSAAQGSGGAAKSQSQVSVNEKTGGTSASSQSGGVNHESQSEVQANEKGGLADAQASGPGQTSSQAQIGFRPDDGASSQHTVFNGGGQASGQASSYSGQSQSQINGNFKYGISYHGAAQGASGTKEQVNQYREQNRAVFQSIDQFQRSNRESLPASNGALNTADLKLRASHQSVSYQLPNNTATAVAEDEVDEYEDEDEYSDEDYETIPETKSATSEHKSSSGSVDVETSPIGLPTPKPILTFSQIFGDQKQQTTVVGTNNFRLIQKQNGHTQYYPSSTTEKIPEGFSGKIDDQHAEKGNGQTTKVIPTLEPKKITTRFLPSKYHDINGKNEDNNKKLDSYVTVTKSVTGSIDDTKKPPAETKNFESTYYTKSSTCGYFTFSCNIVYGSNGRSKICRPKAPTNGKC